MPMPQPISWGGYSEGGPVGKTNKFQAARGDREIAGNRLRETPINSRNTGVADLS